MSVCRVWINTAFPVDYSLPVVENIGAALRRFYSLGVWLSRLGGQLLLPIHVLPTGLPSSLHPVPAYPHAYYHDYSPPPQPSLQRLSTSRKPSRGQDNR